MEVGEPDAPSQPDAPDQPDAPIRDVRPLLPGQLTDGWRWMLAVTWGLVGPALIAIGDAAHSLGKPPWWMSAQSEIAWWSPLVVIPPVAAAVAAATNQRWWPWASGAASAFLLGSGAVNVASTPGIALAEFALGVAGCAATAAAFAGRVRRPAARPRELIA
jgi:hypothetical protein